MFIRSITGFAVVAAVSVSAQAAFVSPTSWTRGDGGATYQAWDVFSSLTNAAPDVADDNPNGSATLTETTGTPFITGGGNIYSYATPTAFTVAIPELDVPAPQHNLTAIVQIHTLGTQVDPASLLLNGIAPSDSAELSRIALGGFGGDDVETWFLFQIPYAAFGDGNGGVKILTLTFASIESSMSLDQLSIDTAIRPFGFYAEQNPVPEPATLGLLGGGAMLFAARRRRGE